VVAWVIRRRSLAARSRPPSSSSWRFVGLAEVWHDRRMAVRPLPTASVALALAGAIGLASTACQAEHAHEERVRLEALELRMDEPRVIRWLLCKEGLGTGEAINAELDLRIEHLGTTPGRIDVRRWASASAFEADDEPMPFPTMDVVSTQDQLRISLRPQGPFTRDGRRCTDDEYLELDGEGVIVEPSIEARVLDWGGVIDRLILEAEMLP
jgi:hypothetical protein